MRTIRTKTVGTLALAMLMMLTLAPAAAAASPGDVADDLATTQEHCWKVGAEAGPVQTAWGPCERAHVDVDEDGGEKRVTVTIGYREYTIDPRTTAAGPGCWYVIVPEHQVGPVTAAVWQCDPDVQVDPTWDPQEDPLASDWYGNEVRLDDDVNVPTHFPGYHCHFDKNLNGYCYFD